MSAAPVLDVDAPPRARGERRFPVIETFGPTIQGEGPEAGVPCLFVRFGGCDYRCSWCDSMYAVEPGQVRANAKPMTATQIADALPGGAPWVILSGGNPALLELGELVDLLHARGYLVAVETQGSRWKEWLARVDRLVISPKPPSSGMATAEHRDETRLFVAAAERAWIDGRLEAAVKIVVFDDEDFAWAADFACGPFPLYLSAGTPYVDGEPTETSRIVMLAAVADRYGWLCEKVAANAAELGVVRVLPQLHVIAWGTARGV